MIIIGIIICILLAIIALMCTLIFINTGHILDCYIDVNQDTIMRDSNKEDK